MATVYYTTAGLTEQAEKRGLNFSQSHLQRLIREGHINVTKVAVGRSGGKREPAALFSESDMERILSKLTRRAKGRPTNSELDLERY